MKLIYILATCLLFSSNSQAQYQNLVPNGNFEYHTSCPTDHSQLSLATPWRDYHEGTSDYFHKCNNKFVSVPKNAFGWQYAASGDGYAGGFSYTNLAAHKLYTEYLASPITPMTIGIIYEVSMSVSLSDLYSTGNNGLGIWLYDDGPTSTITKNMATLTVTPQISFESYGPIIDTQNWVRLTATFKADSAYDNIVIGKFTPHTGLITAVVGNARKDVSYYYIDSVVIKALTGINILYTDSTVCVGDTFRVPYSLKGNIGYTAGNIFYAQLSDLNGNFASGTTMIGSVIATTGGSIPCVIPPTVVPGNNYSIRVLSTTPVDSSDANLKKITIGSYPNFNASNNGPVCEGAQLNLTATLIPGTAYQWKGPNGFNSALYNPVINIAQVADSGVYIVNADLNGCISKDTTVAVVYPFPVINITGNIPVCLNDTLRLLASGRQDNVIYKWTGPKNFMTNDSIVTIPEMSDDKAGKYNLTASYKLCSVDSSVNVDLQKIELGNNILLCDNEIQIITVDMPDVTCSWQDGSTKNEYTVSRPGKYWVTVAATCGNLNDTIEVAYQNCECTPFVPSAFTPNNDNRNDNIAPILSCQVSSYNFLIVNRFGEAVFKSNNPKQKWDGNYKGLPADIGTYFYMLQLTGPYNKNFLFKGDITLIR